MLRRTLGVDGPSVSRLGLGTASWARSTDLAEAREQLVAFTEAGGTLVDTAAGYGEGASEEMLGSLVGDVVARDDVMIATKAGARMGPSGPEPDTSRESLLRSLDDSLRRLRVDHVDLWQLHLWSDSTPLEETLGALDHAVGTGRASYVGISNYQGWQSAQAATTQRWAPGGAPLVSHQVEYSLVHRAPEAEVVPAARALGLGILAFSPLGGGVLTGKYRHGTPADSRAASPQLARFVTGYLDERGARIVEAVAGAADQLGRAPLEVALAWVRDRPGVSAALVGSRTADQLRDALGAEDLELPDDVVTALEVA